jgi:hypothetical protein
MSSPTFMPWSAQVAAAFASPLLLAAGLSYLLLADLFANFFRYFVSKTWHDKCLWGGAAQMKHVLTRVNAGMLHLAAAHDKYLSAEKPMITLKVGIVRLQMHCTHSTSWVQCA